MCGVWYCYSSLETVDSMVKEPLPTHVKIKHGNIIILNNLNLNWTMYETLEILDSDLKMCEIKQNIKVGH